ncbi:MAG TPA: hypothetical protein VHN39_08375 [Phenylobacterium sp.]|jgi:hypothetical protein|nr:hypothetical protein [Phenylobacterium sp.]
MSFLSLRPTVALCGLALVLAAVPRASAAAEPVQARRISLAPLFDTHTRFKKKKTVKLRFRVKDSSSGAPLALDEVSFSLRHGAEAALVQLPARALHDGVFEVPFTPAAPGQYWVIAAVRGEPAAAIAPIRLGVIGIADGMIEVPEKGDVDVKRSIKMSPKGR